MTPPGASARDERLGTAAAFGAALLYGAAYPATAVALRSFGPLAIAGIACTIALPLVLLAAWLRLIQRPRLEDMTGDRLWRLVVLATIGGLAFIVATNVAVALSGAAITGLVAPLYSVAATVLAVPLLGERVRPTTILAFGSAVLGAALLAGTDPSQSNLAGVGMGVAAATLFGLYIVLSRRWSGPYALDGTLVTIANLIGRGPVLLAIAALVQPGPLVTPDPDPLAVFALLTIALGSSSTGNLLLMASVRRVPAARTAAALLLAPVASTVLAVTLLGEHLSTAGVVGAVLVLVGMAVAARGSSPPPPRDTVVEASG